jgi:CDP-glucose 4,6-dehydratase
VEINSDFWAQRRVLITGHTGFKGAWLSLWLQALGAQVTGLAPGPPTSPSLYELAAVGASMRERAVDVRDAEEVRTALLGAAPDVVMHLAAQPMVRRSLRDPAMTYAVNVMGTVNVLEAVRSAGNEVRAVVVVTSDKCYENRGEPSRRFVEDDRLGGDDPYSSSKACAELVADAYRRSFFSGQEHPRVATARAGNVIGGGDWGEDRLVADVVRAAQAGEPVRVRNPHAVRPWQHVLNPLSGYLRLAEQLWHGEAAARAWNFGPREADARTVSWIVERLGGLWGGDARWELDENANPAEAGHLALDSSAAERDLAWRAGWDLDEALRRVVEWYRAQRRNQDMRAVSMAQIEQFERSL